MSNGGTNSTASLTNGCLMYSNAGQIVEGTSATLPAFTQVTLLGTSNQLRIAPGGFHYDISASTPAANRVYSLPDALTNANIVLDQGNYTIGGTWTFSNNTTMAGLTLTSSEAINAATIVPLLVNNNSVSAGQVALGLQVDGTTKTFYEWSSANGIYFFDNVNSNIWLQQGGVSGQVKSLHNTLDDGTGNVTIAGKETVAYTANGILAGTTSDMNGHSFALAVGAPSGTGTWPFGVITGGGASGVPVFTVSNSNVVATKNNTLDDGAGNMTLANTKTLSVDNIIGASTALRINPNTSAPSIYLGHDVSGTTFNITLGSGTNTAANFQVLNNLANVFHVTSAGAVTTESNTLDDGSTGAATFAGELTVNTSAGTAALLKSSNSNANNNILMLNNTAATQNSVGMGWQFNGTNKMHINYSTTAGIAIVDNSNNTNWLYQNGTTSGNVQTLNNTLDDGTGHMLVPYPTASPSGIQIGASGDINGNYGFAIGAPSGATIWPFGVHSYISGTKQRTLYVEANGTCGTYKNTLDDGGGNATFSAKTVFTSNGSARINSSYTTISDQPLTPVAMVAGYQNYIVTSNSFFHGFYLPPTTSQNDGNTVTQIFIFNDSNTSANFYPASGDVIVGRGTFGLTSITLTAYTGVYIMQWGGGARQNILLS